MVLCSARRQDHNCPQCTLCSGRCGRGCALQAASLSSVGSLSSATLSTGAVTAAAVQLSGDLSLAGSSRLVGTVVLGDNGLFTVVAWHRPRRRGRSTSFIGQSAGNVLSAGGDVIFDAGTGLQAGRVLIGGASQTVVLGAVGSTVTSLRRSVGPVCYPVRQCVSQSLTASGAVSSAETHPSAVSSLRAASLCLVTVLSSLSAIGSVTASAGLSTSALTATTVAAQSLSAQQLTATTSLSAASVTVANDINAGSATLSGALSAQSVSVSGTVSVTGAFTSAAASVGSLSTAGTVSVGGSATMVGSILLGGNSAYTMARATNTASTNGFATVLIGQRAGHAQSLGGDLILEAGTGGTAGVVRVGQLASAVLLGSATAPVTASGAFAADSVTVTNLVRAGSLSATGSATVGALSSAGPVTATALQTSGTVSATAVTASAGVQAAHASGGRCHCRLAECGRSDRIVGD